MVIGRGVTLLVGVLGLVVVACGGDGSDRSAVPESPAGGETASPSEDAVAANFEGSTIELIVAYDAGSSQDMQARLMADHLSDKIPGNPDIKVSNQPGGEGLAAYQIIRNAEPDGLTLLLAGSSAPVDQLLGPYLGEEGSASLGFDIRELAFVGGTGPVPNAVWTNGDSGVRSAEDLQPGVEIIGGAPRPGSSTYMFLALLREVTGVDMNITTGYASGSDVSLALLRNEIQLQGGNWSTFVGSAEGLDDQGELVPLVAYVQQPPEEDYERLGVEPIPNIHDLTNDEETQQLVDSALASQAWGRLILAPPGTPQEIVDALGSAFASLVDDPEFVEARDASDVGDDLRPLGNKEVRQMIDEYFETPEPVLERLAALLTEGQ